MCTDERESRSPEPFAFGILYRERANKVFGKRLARLLNIFAIAHPPSKSGAAAYRRLRRRLLHSVRRTVFVPSVPFVFPKAKTQYIYCCLIQFFIMFAEMIMIWLCLATSMIELFMLDLVMVMIYFGI